MSGHTLLAFTQVKNAPRFIRSCVSIYIGIELPIMSWLAALTRKSMGESKWLKPPYPNINIYCFFLENMAHISKFIQSIFFPYSKVEIRQTKLNDSRVSLLLILYNHSTMQFLVEIAYTQKKYWFIAKLLEKNDNDSIIWLLYCMRLSTYYNN